MYNHSLVFSPRDAPEGLDMQITFVLILRSALLRASRRMATRVHAAILRDAAEFFIGPRFARTRTRRRVPLGISSCRPRTKDRWLKVDRAAKEIGIACR